MANLSGNSLLPGHTKERRGEITFSLVRRGVLLWFLFSLVFTGCSNFLLDKPQPAGGSGDYGIVEIHLDSGGRTLRPDSIAAFSGYRIKVWYLDRSTYPYVEIIDSEAVIGAGTLIYQIRMEAGISRTITVAALTGDISNNGEDAAEVAWWQQDDVTIFGGKVTALQVELKAEAAEGEGVFAYTVSFPAGEGVSSGSLVFTPMSQSGAAAKVSLPIDSAVTENGSAIITGTKTLNAGYYLVTADLLAAGMGAKSGTKTAVAHIYKNLQTPSDDAFAFAHADFTALTVLSTADYGGLRATLNALAVQGAGEYTIVLDTNESAFTPYTMTTANFANKIITLRGGAYDTVKLSGNGSLFTMQSGVSLVLKDITLKGIMPEGSLSNYWSLPWGNRNNAALIALDGASLVLEAGSRITGNCHYDGKGQLDDVYGGGIYAVNNASIVINGGVIDENMIFAAQWSNAYGGGVSLHSGSSLIMNYGSILNNICYAQQNMYGGGDSAGPEIMTFSDDCLITINGGFCHIFGWKGTVKVNGGDITGITGGTGQPTVEIHGGKISGDIYVPYGNFIMYGGEINGSVSAESAVIYNGRISRSPDYYSAYSYGIYAAGDVIIHNGEITNSSHAVYSGGNITIYNGTFTGNEYGGVDAGGTLTISGGTFTGNGRGYSSSGSLDTWAAAAGNDVVISGGTFTGNRSGVFFRKSFDLSGGLIRDNETDITVGHETVYNTDTLLYETTRGVFTLDAAFTAKAAYRPDWNWAVSGDFTMTAGQARSVNILGANPGSYDATRLGGIFTLNGGKISGQLNGSLVTIGNEAVFTMNSGEISGNTLPANAGYGTESNGVTVLKGGLFTLNNGLIKNNEGYGVSVTDGVFTMTGGEISGNDGYVLLRTSSIYDPDYYARFNLSGGAINNNSAGGINVWPGSVFTMTGGGIENNAGSGVDNQGTFTMSGGTISGNTAENGGGIHNNGKFTLSGGTISGNTALRGSGVYAESNSTTIITGGGAVDPSNVVHIGAETYAPGGQGYIYGYITLNSPLSGSGLVAKIDLSHTMPYWRSSEIIKLKDGYAEPVPTERFVLGDFVNSDYLHDTITRTPMTGYTIRADGRGSWCTADASILSFSIAGVQGRINGNDISVTLPHTGNLSALAPLITVSGGATVSPASGQAVDFKDPATFKVTASDGSSRIYTVRVILSGAVPQGGLTVIDAFTALPGGITPVVNGMVISLTGEGFTGYSWYVDGILRETGSNTINMSAYPPGPHNVTLTVLKNGIPYSSQAALTVQ
jgi:hypothetical protein